MYDNYNRVLIYGYCGLTTVYPSSETFLKGSPGSQKRIACVKTKYLCLRTSTSYGTPWVARCVLGSFFQFSTQTDQVGDRHLSIREVRRFYKTHT